MKFPITYNFLRRVVYLSSFKSPQAFFAYIKQKDKKGVIDVPFEINQTLRIENCEVDFNAPITVNSSIGIIVKGRNNRLSGKIELNGGTETYSGRRADTGIIFQDTRGLRVPEIEVTGFKEWGVEINGEGNFNSTAMTLEGVKAHCCGTTNQWAGNNNVGITYGGLWIHGNDAASISVEKIDVTHSGIGFFANSTYGTLVHRLQAQYCGVGIQVGTYQKGNRGTNVLSYYFEGNDIDVDQQYQNADANFNLGNGSTPVNYKAQN
jgi:hypothetical protein